MVLVLNSNVYHYYSYEISYEKWLFGYPIFRHPHVCVGFLKWGYPQIIQF
jgi:hypothetical protein